MKTKITNISINRKLGVLKEKRVFTNWINDYKKANANALAGEWFVSPLEYFWADGKKLFDRIFSVTSIKNKNFDSLVSSEIFKTSMNFHFRAQMLVLGFMKQNIAKTFGLEIENGLLHLYQLDFLSTISQWIYVIEGYSRKLFNVQSNQSSKYRDWQIPRVNDPQLDELIVNLAESLGSFLSSVLFASSNNRSIDTINRHLLLHGNSENNDIWANSFDW